MLVVASICISACRSSTPLTQPETTYRTIRNQSRRGEFLLNSGAERAYAVWQSHPENQWHWKFKLLYAEMLLLNGDTRKASALLSSAPPAAFSWLSPRFEMLRGYVAYREGRDADAERELLHAAASAHAASDFELEADTKLILATYASPDQASRIESVIEQILQIGRDHGLSYQVAAAYLNYGMLRIRQSRFAEAIQYLNSATQTAQQAGATLLYGIAAGNMATCYYNLGDFDRALQLRNKAIDVQKRAGLKTPLRDSYLELGVSQWLQGDSTQAVASLRQALALVDAQDSPEPYSLIAINLASALESAGSLDEAESLTAKALQISKSKDPDLLASAALNEAAVAEHRGHHDIAIERYLKAISVSAATPSSLWSAHAELASVYANAGQVKEAREHFEAAIRIIDASRADQLQSRYKITFLSRLIRLYQEYVDLLVQQGDESRALEIADSSRAGVLTQDLIGEKSRAQGGLVRRVQKIAQQSDSTFLFYWLAPKRSYLWVVTEDGLKTIPLPDGPRIAADVKSYRYLLEQEKLDPLTAPHQLPSRLFQQLVAPALEWVPHGTRVVIVPDDALHGLNFESLIVDAPQPHYWLEDVTVSVAPSLGMTMAKGGALKQKPSLLVFGDPDAIGTGFAKLPYAAAEVERISKHFPAENVTLRRGTDAVPSAYRDSQPQRFSAIHFATHAEANEQSPLDSAIILSKQNDGFRLYAREVMQLPLTAELVTLSACRGAGARTFSGEGLVGFAWAFFQAGAQNVIAGLWDVNDRSTSDLMDSFYGKVEDGESYAVALQNAKLAMLQTQFRKPYYWAPFQLYSRNLGAVRRK